MLKKYFKDILICFAFVIGFGCGWYGCKSYMRHKLNRLMDQWDKLYSSEYCDTIINDTITSCEF